jgi:ribulose-5-phosphate 4-epimerase/fuculose-1-phosphate aldolase
MNLVNQLVVANRVLAREQVVDAYGHASLRHPEHPERFLLACSRAPELVEPRDILEFDLQAQPLRKDARPLYLERFIHAAIYEARPDVMAVVHAHAEDVLPFTIAAAGPKASLRPVIHSGAFIGAQVPVWDIADKFGDRTNLLVTDMAQARDLAGTLGRNPVALMRGHGFAAAARSLIDVVRMSVYLPRNARVQHKAMQLGEFKPLSQGEIDSRLSGYKPDSPETQRAWRYWAVRAGCGSLLDDPA